MAGNEVEQPPSQYTDSKCSLFIMAWTTIRLYVGILSYMYHRMQHTKRYSVPGTLNSTLLKRILYTVIWSRPLLQWDDWLASDDARVGYNQPQMIHLHQDQQCTTMQCSVYKPASDDALNSHQDQQSATSSLLRYPWQWSRTVSNFIFFLGVCDFQIDSIQYKRRDRLGLKMIKALKATRLAWV